MCSGQTREYIIHTNICNLFILTQNIVFQLGIWGTTHFAIPGVYQTFYQEVIKIMLSKF